MIYIQNNSLTELTEKIEILLLLLKNSYTIFYYFNILGTYFYIGMDLLWNSVFYGKTLIQLTVYFGGRGEKIFGRIEQQKAKEK